MNPSNCSKTAAMLVSSALLSVALPAGASTIYNFACFENCANLAAGAPALLGAQMSMEVADYTVTGATNDVTFTFRNNVGVASSITDIYWDTGTTALLASINILSQSSGVNFAMGADPSNVPGATNINFTADQSSDSAPPPIASGIDSSTESLTFLATLSAGKTLADVVASMNSATASDLRVALHVQAIAGQSAGFVNGSGGPPPNGTPEPGSMALVLAGLGGLAWIVRRPKGSTASASVRL